MCLKKFFEKIKNMLEEKKQKQREENEYMENLKKEVLSENKDKIKNQLKDEIIQEQVDKLRGRKKKNALGIDTERIRKNLKLDGNTNFNPQDKIGGKSDSYSYRDKVQKILK